jgi:hypothetical protein
MFGWRVDLAVISRLMDWQYKGELSRCECRIVWHAVKFSWREPWTLFTLVYILSDWLGWRSRTLLAGYSYVAAADWRGPGERTDWTYMQG